MTPTKTSSRSTFNEALAALRSHTNNDKAKVLQRFFKTGPGEYGFGDQFLGVTVPQIRCVAKEFQNLSLSNIKELLHSKVHEERLLALIILVKKFQNADSNRGTFYNFYMHNLKQVNNWDLVDSSAPYIVGAYLESKDRRLLDRLAKSKRLWDRRVAILSTLHFIRKGEFTDTLRLAKNLFHDPEDLMHKAVGWMLREVGKRNVQLLEDFLRQNHRTMPRTMLRYAIERLPEQRRKAYLKGLS